MQYAELLADDVVVDEEGEDENRLKLQAESQPEEDKAGIKRLRSMKKNQKTGIETYIEVTLRPERGIENARRQKQHHGIGEGKGGLTLAGQLSHQHAHADGQQVIKNEGDTLVQVQGVDGQIGQQGDDDLVDDVVVAHLLVECGQAASLLDFLKPREEPVGVIAADHAQARKAHQQPKQAQRGDKEREFVFYQEIDDPAFYTLDRVLSPNNYFLATRTKQGHYNIIAAFSKHLHSVSVKMRRRLAITAKSVDIFEISGKLIGGGDVYEQCRPHRGDRPAGHRLAVPRLALAPEEHLEPRAESTA